MKNQIACYAFTVLAFVAAASAEAQAVKWHPGHYITLSGGDTQSQHFSHINEIGKESSIKGVLVRIWWYDLERSKGNYDFSKIDAYLAKLKSLPNKKRLVIRVMDRRFSTSNRNGIVPAYLMNESQYNGGVVKSKNGYTSRLWEQPVMDRLIALYQALGTRYDSEEYFEGVATNETTLGFGTSKPSGYSTTALAKQYERFANAARKNMPRTNLFLSTNFLGSDAVMGNLVQSLIDPALAVSGPNTVPGDPSSAQSVWIGQTGADYRGRLAIGSGVETGELGGNHGDFTPRQIYDYAFNTLRVNYMFWVRNSWTGDSGQRWSTGILPFLRTNPPVRTSCPAAYGICATQ